MTAADIDRVLAIADAVHPDFPEDRAVFANRIEVFAAGCLSLGVGQEMVGYLISHPARQDAPPALNSALPGLPSDADCYYIHDLALLPVCRGTGLGRRGASLAGEIALQHGFHRMALIAVNHSAPFWQSCGFRVVQPERMRAKLASYGDASLFMVRDIPGQG